MSSLLQCLHALLPVPKCYCVCRCLPAATLQPVVASLDPQSCSPALAAVVEATWPLLLHTMAADAQQLTPAAVLQACKDALDAIGRVVVQQGAASSATAVAGHVRPEEDVVVAFAARQERFRSRVLDAAIQQEVDEVGGGNRVAGVSCACRCVVVACFALLG